jgi:hypothetical protein
LLASTSLVPYVVTIAPMALTSTYRWTHFYIPARPPVLYVSLSAPRVISSKGGNLHLKMRRRRPLDSF